MKRKFNGAALGKDFAFFFTVFGWVIGYASYIAFQEIYIPWVVISALGYMLAIAAYILVARIVDSVENFIHAILARHTMVSICSVVLSIAFMLAMNRLEGLIVVFLALYLIVLGYLPPAVHQIIRAVDKLKRRKNSRKDQNTN